VVYCGLRVTGQWNGSALVDITRNFSDERADSLQFRLEQEEVLSERAWERPMLGWGGFNRAFPPPNASDVRQAVSDSLWIVVFGMNGVVGLVSIILTLVAPIYALSRRWRPTSWTHPEFASAGVLAIVLGLYLMDGMVNMMINPMFTLAIGSLTGLAIGARAPVKAPVVSESKPSPVVTG
jgi:O-antigen ligase